MIRFKLCNEAMPVLRTNLLCTISPYIDHDCANVSLYYLETQIVEQSAKHMATKHKSIFALGIANQGRILHLANRDCCASTFLKQGLQNC